MIASPRFIRGHVAVIVLHAAIIATSPAEAAQPAKETKSRVVPKSTERPDVNRTPDRNTLELLNFFARKKWGFDSDDELVAKFKTMKFDPAYRSPQGETLLHLVVRTGYRDLLEHLIKHGIPVNAQDKKKRTAMHRALEPDKGDVLAVGTLLDHGADPNIRNEDGETALHLAIFHMSEETVSLLLASSKTNVNIADDEGVTPLMLAAEYSDLALIEKLLERRADKRARDKAGRSAAQHASGSNMEEVREWLSK